ncbi:MAG: DUF255 domain-containing protein [Epsilonproteobacteria bacterium]|nr:MAG: DUF255 domain-containing protein [Campylobacterota bacterium]
MFHSLVTTFLLLAFLSTSLFSTTKTIDINTLSLQAKKEQKHLLLFFHKEGCGFCIHMRYETLEDEPVADMIEKYFIFVDIGIDEEGSIEYRDFHGSNHAYAKSLKISFYPTVGFVDGNNSMVYGVIGHRDSEELSMVLEYVYTHAYKVMEWEDFKSKLEFEREDED